MTQLKSIKGGDLHPGDCVSIDQYVYSHKGQLAVILYANLLILNLSQLLKL